MESTRGNFGAYFSIGGDDASLSRHLVEVKDAELALSPGGISMVGVSSQSPSRRSSNAYHNSYDSLDASASHVVDTTDDDDEVVETPAALALAYVGRLPAVLVSMLLVLFQTVSFGGICFPGSWVSVPPSLGFQIMIFATIVGQVFLTFGSCFDFAIALVMVENVQLMHGIADIVMANQLKGAADGSTDVPYMSVAVYTTTMVAFALTTIVTGVFFFLLGRFKLGSIVSSFPRHTIVGLIGGIGIFLSTSGLEVSTSVPWDWNAVCFKKYASHALVPLWLLTVFLVVLLRLIVYVTKWNNVSPFFFLSIPFAFYGLLWVAGVSIESAHEFGWFFPLSPTDNIIGGQSPFMMWTLIDLSLVDWAALWQCVPTAVALVVFSLSHVPINVPSLSISTGTDANMNDELTSHGVFNFVSGICGGLPSYLCYCISLANFKLGNTSGKRSHTFGGRLVSYLCGSTLVALELVLFFKGPAVLGHIPRCLGGTLLLNVGLDLTWEALVDCFFTFDSVEYVSVVVITVVITLYGMTEGLIVCAISAAATFVIQSAINSNDVGVIKSIRTARTLRSSRRRVKKILQLLESESTSVTVIQLQGYVFFANSMDIFLKVHHLLEENKRNATLSGARAPPYVSRRDSVSLQPVLRFLVLDFTLVQSIDSSAAETVAKLHELCTSYRVRLCYSRGPTLRNDFRMERLDRLLERTQSASGGGEGSDECDRAVHACDSLDEALAWCEDCIIKTNAAHLELVLASEENSVSNLVQTDDDSSRLEKISGTFLSLFKNPAAEGGDIVQTTLRTTPRNKPSAALHAPRHVRTPSYQPIRPPHTLQLLALCPDEPAKVEKLVAHFRRQEIESGMYLWQIGDEPDFCVLLSAGGLSASCSDRHFLAAASAAATGVDSGADDETILVGHLVGEYSMLMNVTRQGSLRATQDSTVYVLNRGDYLALDDDLKVLLFQVCLNYLGHRALHVSNRMIVANNVPV